jgi:AraC-like DNA-binding protein
LPAQLLEGLDVTLAELAEPGATLPLEKYVALWDRARTLTAEPGLGFYFGLSSHATGIGYAGFAAMSAETLGQALELLRYTPMISTMFSLHLEVRGDVASIIVDEHADPGTVRDLLLVSLLVGLRQLGEDITGVRGASTIDLAIPQPDYHRRFAAVVPNVRFGQQLNRLSFPVSLLASRLVMADEVAMRLAREQCERALEDLSRGTMLVARVRQALARSEGFRSFRQVAAELRFSPTSLRMMLVRQGISFASLVDDERQKRALRLLSNRTLPLKSIAQQLGYSSVSNFARAFHRWKGQTPKAYRRDTIDPDIQSNVEGAAKTGKIDR